MTHKVIFDYFHRYTGAFYSALLLIFLTLSGVNTWFNFDIPATSQIRDAGPILPNYSIAEPLHISSLLANSNVQDVPSTSTISSNYSAVRYFTQRRSASVASSGLTRFANIKAVSSPSVDAGTGIKSYGTKFLYAHSSLAFAPLKSLNEGAKFEVEQNGQVFTYIVSRQVVFNRASDLDSNSARRKAIYNASYNGKTYDLALMTCGNGTNDDPAYRLVVFATRI